MKELVDQIEELATAGTPGKWYVSDFEVLSNGDPRVVMGGDGFAIAYLNARSRAENAVDAALIVALRNAIPEIVQALRDGEKMRALLADIADSPPVPTAYQWSGDDGLEDMFDPELRHKNGSKPVDYLKAWLSMFRPFAFASKSDSWGELEKLICIVMRNYVRMAAKNARARSALTGEGQ